MFYLCDTVRRVLPCASKCHNKQELTLESVGWDTPPIISESFQNFYWYFLDIFVVYLWYFFDILYLRYIDEISSDEISSIYLRYFIYIVIDIFVEKVGPPKLYIVLDSRSKNICYATVGPEPVNTPKQNISVRLWQQGATQHNFCNKFWYCQGLPCINISLIIIIVI